MTTIDTICERISANSRFVADYDSMTRESILRAIGTDQATSMEEEALRRLLQSAALFAQSSKPEWRQIAYRIGVGSLGYKEALEGVVDAVRLTFSRLGNYPAIDYAFKTMPEPTSLPQSIFYEIVGRKDQYTVRIGDRAATLTDMQKTVWDAALDGGSLALSAPTSSGKSFIFLGYIEQLKRTKPNANVVYLVPSRALISQVATDLRNTGLDRLFGIATVPLVSAPSEHGTPIYVLTPERLQVLFQTSESLIFDVAIVDEAHLIGEGSRGVILHSILQELQRRKPGAQFLFSSPQVRDPAVFGSIVGDSSVRVVKTEDSPVAQNIILLKGTVLDSKKLTVSLWHTTNQVPLVETDALIPIYNSQDRLVYASWSFGRAAQSLVYAEGPAACEDIALRIKDLCDDPSLGIQEAPDEVRRRRKDLSDFAKEAVHSTYLLAQTVISGVGFHYGRIPALLRAAVEGAFSNGDLDYIVCTSTLLQGVNLPARNIFMQNPHKGDNRPMEPVDFWNLAGRAGRLGKDFQGNVYLVDYEDWVTSPLSGPKDEPVKPAFERLLTESPSELIEYIELQDEPSGGKPFLEAAFSKLLRDLRHGYLDQTLERVNGVTKSTQELLEAALANANQNIQLDTSTLDASPQISGYRQQQLYDYMTTKIDQEGPDYLIPVHPSAPWAEALAKLRLVFARVHKYLELKSGNHHRYWAPMALRWMRGAPLPQMIEGAIEYYRGQGKSRANRTIIREILDAVENDLRFRYVNLLGCYTAVLREALADTGHTDHVKKIPALTLYLELGAASQTMVHLMGLGLSRHTAAIVADQTINKDMDEAATRAYMLRFNPSNAGLSPFLTAEVQAVVNGL